MVGIILFLLANFAAQSGFRWKDKTQAQQTVLARSLRQRTVIIAEYAQPSSFLLKLASRLCLCVEAPGPPMLFDPCLYLCIYLLYSLQQLVLMTSRCGADGRGEQPTCTTLAALPTIWKLWSWLTPTWHVSMETTLTTIFRC